MQIVKRDPGERMNRTEFDPSSEFSDRETHVGYYVCPHCEAAVRFRTSDFERHFATESSNLPPPSAKAFEEADPGRNPWDGFLDFECPGCRAPVRLVYRPREFAMGAFAFTVDAVLEAGSWPA